MIHRLDSLWSPSPRPLKGLRFVRTAFSKLVVQRARKTKPSGTSLSASLLSTPMAKLLLTRVLFLMHAKRHSRWILPSRTSSMQGLTVFVRPAALIPSRSDNIHQTECFTRRLDCPKSQQRSPSRTPYSVLKTVWVWPSMLLPFRKQTWWNWAVH